MTVTAPPASGVRHHWADLPDSVRSAVEDILGARVVHAQSQSGGFSPGVAARVRLTDGRRAFVKAVSAEANPGSPDLHRAEARNTAALPPGAPVPRLLGSYDDGTRVALVLQDIDGRQPRIPWTSAELDRVLTAVGELNRTLTPAPIEAPAVADSEAETFSGWRTLLAARDSDGLPGRLDPWAARHLDVLAGLESGWSGPATACAAGSDGARGSRRTANDQPRAASVTSACMTRRSSPISGCHCTPSAHRAPGSSTASTVPSAAWADATRSGARRSTAWWW